MKRVIYYFSIWVMMSKYSFKMVLGQKKAFLIFFVGKVLRFGMFFTFLSFVLGSTQNFAGYTSTQALFIYLTFNILDVSSQFLFREIYRFRPLVVSGGFDLTLVRPISPLFRSLLGGADIIDAVTLPPLFIITFLVGKSLSPTPIEIIYYLVLVTNGFLISTTFHICVLAFGIITLEVDNVVMVYRDFMRLGSLPVDVYKEPLKSILSYLVPVALMITFPARALYGLSSFTSILLSVLVGVTFLFLSFKFWRFALTRYTSASS